MGPERRRGAQGDPPRRTPATKERSVNPRKETAPFNAPHRAQDARQFCMSCLAAQACLGNVRFLSEAARQKWSGNEHTANRDGFDKGVWRDSFASARDAV